jgi:predicted RNA-binding Zn ribbon-like protein
MTITVQNTNDLLSYLEKHSESRKDWFGFTQQKMTGITLAHQIAANHADKMSPEQVITYAINLNELIYRHIIVGKNG